MHDVEFESGEPAVQDRQGTPPHQPVFRVQRHGARGQADGVGRSIGFDVVSRIVGRHYRDPHAESGEVGTKGQDRGGDAVDAWKVDVAEHQYMQLAAVARRGTGDIPGHAVFLRATGVPHAATGAAGLMKWRM